MAIKPILFNTEMVRAILDGRKTQTRRVMKPQAKCTVPRDCATCNEWRLDGKTSDACPSTCVTTPEPPCSVGDILWVRETWSEMPYGYVYHANEGNPEGWDADDRWHPSIHMPKETARIFLMVKDVRVERLNDILAHAGEVAKEGIPYSDEGDIEASGLRFKELWDSTIKPADRERYGWDANPWVWVIEFERCEKPEGWCSE